ncbi:MAG TPA: DedA family protein [Bdellovibrionota bacterium]|nr:DedA family protein [Bdellovibrionota bacterium]
MDRLIDFLTQFSGPWAIYAAIFGILVACGFGLPIPEDITLFTAGYLAYDGDINILATIVVCFLGVMIGDTAIFTLGHKYGRKVANRWVFRRILSPERLERVKKRLHSKRGTRIVFFARFMPGMRAAIFFSSGTLHLPYRVFLLNDGLAAGISVPTIITVVYRFGDKIDYVIKIIKKVQFGIIGLIIAFVAILVAKWYLESRRLPKTTK